MPKLYNQISNELLGDISDAQLQFLMDQLEEETMADQDNAIESMTLAYFESQGIDPELLKILRNALGDQEQVIIRWEN